MRYGPGYGGPSSRRDGRPTAAEFLDGVNSRGWREGGRERDAGRERERYVMPRDDNRYVYPSAFPGESRRERREERRDDRRERRDRRWF